MIRPVAIFAREPLLAGASIGRTFVAAAFVARMIVTPEPAARSIIVAATVVAAARFKGTLAATLVISRAIGAPLAAPAFAAVAPERLVAPRLVASPAKTLVAVVVARHRKKLCLALRLRA